MATDPHAAGFYATRQGAVVAGLVAARLRALWTGLPGQRVLGLGHAHPYLPLWREEAERCIALTTPPAPASHWPDQAANCACVAGEEALPFPDLCFDRVLLVHGLEAAENGRRLLREVWRVLRDDGRLIVVAPNRRGMWAHVEATPFGQGQPYSPRQIDRLLTGTLFRIERRDTALYMPPYPYRVILRGAHVWERAGRWLAPELAGVTLTEAVKDVYAAVPLTAPRRRLVLANAA